MVKKRGGLVKKILLAIICLVSIRAIAQNPVIVTQPYKFQKWVQVYGSLYADSIIVAADSSQRVPNTAWVKRLTSGVLGHSLTNAYGISTLNFNGTVAQQVMADTLSSGGLVSKSRLSANLTGYGKLNSGASIQEWDGKNEWTANMILSNGNTLNWENGGGTASMAFGMASGVSSNKSLVIDPNGNTLDTVATKAFARTLVTGSGFFTLASPNQTVTQTPTFSGSILVQSAMGSGHASRFFEAGSDPGPGNSTVIISPSSGGALNVTGGTTNISGTVNINGTLQMLTGFTNPVAFGAGTNSYQIYSDAVGGLQITKNLLPNGIAINGNVLTDQSGNVFWKTGSVATLTSVGITGTAGAGFVNYIANSAAPTVTTGHVATFGNTSSQFSIVGSNGFVASLSRGHMTASHVFTFQNKDYTLADSADVAGKQATLTAGRGINLSGATIAVDTTVTLNWTKGLNLTSTATNGFQIFNTVDQTVAYEKFNMSYISNVLNISTNMGTGGTVRSISIGTNPTANSTGASASRNMTINSTTGVAGGMFNFIGTGSNAGSLITAQGTYNGSTTKQNILTLQPTINQTSTAGAAMYKASPFWQGVGSGVNNLIEVGNNSAASNGGNDTLKAVIKRNGNILQYSKSGLNTGFVEIGAPSSVTTYGMTWPSVAPTSNGQGISFTTAGVGSFVTLAKGALATLASGTVAITVTGVTTSSVCTVTEQSGRSSLTVAYKAVCTANTITITALVAADTINAADNSVVNYIYISL